MDSESTGIKGFFFENDDNFWYNLLMGAIKTVEYPTWVEEWREPGHTIRKKGDGYALYHCTTIRRPGEPPKYQQTYLGRITENEGFIPKAGTADPVPYLEYGLSHLIWENLREDILGHLPRSRNAGLLKIGIICFIFGSVDEVFLRSSYLTYGEIEKLAPLAAKLSSEQIRRIVMFTEQELHKRIPSEKEYNMVVKLLMLCVARPGHRMKQSPTIPPCVREVLERQKLKM